MGVVFDNVDVVDYLENFNFISRGFIDFLVLDVHFFDCAEGDLFGLF